MATDARDLAVALARKGFRDGGGAVACLESLGDVPDALVDQIASVASPDTALSSLASIASHMGAAELLDLLASDDELRLRLLVVLGTSEALGDFLTRHPEHVHDLSATDLARHPIPLDLRRQQMEEATTADDLRVAYHRKLLHIAARDLTALTTFEESSAELSDLAVATLGAALRIAREAEPDAALSRLTIMAMGKTGGHELNYLSDVDVIFVHEPVDGADDDAALNAATRLAVAVMKLCREHTGEGTIWEVDAELRPEGKNGPLVRTLASHVAYYEKWASTWEFQALLKARFAAGDEELGQAYIDALSPMIWFASTRPHFVSDVRAMRRRVIDNIPAAQRSRQLKLGAGGLRDVEFAVQLLQLVHGRADETLRSPTTLKALGALIDGGYVGRRDGAAMEEAYEFLRTLEHRIQLYKLRRSHIVPEDPEDLRRLGRSMGFRQNPGEALTKEWQAHRRIVRRLHEKLFYQPLLEAVASLPTDHLRLTPLAAEQRLTALGFVDPKGALAHIQALTSGLSRRAAIQKSLLPAMLAWFAESPDPDGGLLAFRKISEGLGETHWYLRKLRDEGEGAEQLAHVLSSSRYVTDLILRAPDSVALLGDDAELRPLERERLRTEVDLAAGRHRDPQNAIRAVRRVRRRELSRVGIADVLGRLDITEVGEALTDISTATLAGALTASTAAVEAERGEMPTRMSIVLMGRLGGGEAGYGSDADVMFVHDPCEGADETEAASAATAVVQGLRRMLAAPGDDPALEVDAELRPEGKNGPLVRTFASYRAYYEKWSSVWEAQALLRANATVGDADLNARFTQLIDPLRFPEGGATADEVREIRRIKARVDSERLPRGANPKTHLKLGRGGLADVEWTVQLLQMQHAHAVPELRTTRTLQALHAAVKADLVSHDDAMALESAWRLVSRIRNAVVLMRGKGAESMVEHAGDRAGVAHLLGYGMDEGERLNDDYLRTTRHARKVVERIFYE
ncbi:bifunctional [glutamine synthetase] adenylyltransferase/[glutamine synthetase]-adenylyl-L-tyrosine phosphorylase [Aeromicrobium chenweiae]|uniref:Bifunctional glutamine synthetase adenylyltransferase/adenylyl-removing enzyme n=1 Tax=Aeromicrobium chenweiae TaxID=2079793 RepID=A0A2S0WKL9_9ACTN|nr:bifunctional [glutamine synthetase] adenylyltransferase/[glutamine synthetase]-adenylyl-L-tyrosine phosphorylase [Aeromicrobium chenweiae]AWB91885.1 bifunctional glutamine-synthetase adenylyltransferase/deadenyltransferase [Aeromicrobium chenweiae]TGN32733.1 bifunctional [glutamine synthetase] adenylyltransferase/[glutamine synthetase]-adenylyl-L-tyrosine phosphorylase [Aeromicrobium chenweiae]